MSLRINAINMAQVSSIPMIWLWEPYVPLGSLVTLEGHPGVGKSAFSQWIAAMVTRSDFTLASRMITESDLYRLKPTPLNVGLMLGEDHPTNTVRPRLDKLGVPPEKIHILDMVFSEKGILPICLDHHFDLLSRFVQERNIQLLVIDPWLAFISSRAAHNESHVRKILMQLRILAETRHCTILILRHLSKNYRYQDDALGATGNIGLSAMSRIILRVERAREADHVSLRVVKTNLGEKPPMRCFRWENAALIPVDSPQPKINPEEKLSKAIFCLSQHDLATEPVAKVKRSLLEAGVPIRHYWQALESLGWTVVRRNQVWMFEKRPADSLA